MEQNSKRKKSEEQNNEITDRLSTLPESLLCHILSFLPTKTTVTTITLVSRRFRNLWKHLQAFDFYYPIVDGESSENFKRFAVFVNAVLTHRHTRDIKKLSLSCGYSSPQDEDPDPLAGMYDAWIRSGERFTLLSVDTWIRTAAGPHLEELHLELFSSEDHGFRLPVNVLSCPNLHSLSLCGEIFVVLEQSSEICLPSLKTLQIDIGSVDTSSVNILLSGCPNLETIELSFSPKSLAKLCVPSSLKSLKIKVENDIGALLEIDASGLKYLSLTKVTFKNFAAIGNFHNVKEAYLDLFSIPENESVDLLLTLLEALSRIKHLVLSCYTAKRLLGGQATINFSNIHFPDFRHLLHLELILPTFDNFLYEVLQKCSMLQALIIQNDKDPSTHVIVAKPKPKCVPICLVSHLTFIHFKEYQGSLCEQEFAGYVLQNGLVLKKMLISGFLFDQKKKSEKYRVLRSFSNMPRGSSVCHVKFV